MAIARRQRAAALSLVGIVGGRLDIMPAGQFWAVHVAAILGAAAIFMGVRLAFGHLLLPAAEGAAAGANSGRRTAAD